MEANNWNTTSTEMTSATNPFAAILNAYAEFGQVNDSRQIMYALHDINGDGSPELFVRESVLGLTGIYTLRNGMPESVIQLGNHRYLLGLFTAIDGRYIIAHGNAHMDHAWEYLYTLDEDGALTVQVKLYTNGLDWSRNPDRCDYGESPMYFRSRLIDGEEVSITEEEYIALINKYGSWGFYVLEDIEVRGAILEWRPIKGKR